MVDTYRRTSRSVTTKRVWPYRSSRVGAFRNLARRVKRRTLAENRRFAVIWCRSQGIVPSVPWSIVKRLKRYSFLSGYALRDDAEEQELQTLRSELAVMYRVPEWDVVARKRRITRRK